MVVLSSVIKSLIKILLASWADLKYSLWLTLMFPVDSGETIEPFKMLFYICTYLHKCYLNAEAKATFNNILTTWWSK